MLKKTLLSFLTLSLLFPALVLKAQDAPLDSLTLDSLFADSIAQEEIAAEEALLEVVEDDSEDKTPFSLKSPKHSVITHLHYLQPETYHPDTSAMAFWGKHDDFSMEKIAIMLKQYLDGKGYYILPDEIPDDPRYVDSLTNKWKYVLVEEEPGIYLYRKHGKWYYSQSTVLEVPKLHKELYPFGTLDFIPEWAKNKVLGLGIWKWLGIIIFILLTFIAHKIFTWLLGWILDGVLSRFLRKKGKVALAVFETVARPLSLLVLALLLGYFLPILQLPPALNQWVVIGIKIIKPVFVVIAIYKLVDVIAAFSLEKAKLTESTADDQLIPLLRKIAKGLVIVAGVIFVLQSLKVDITALLAGISIGGLAIALAAQDTVKNFIGSLLIFLDKPFQVGDWIIADGVEGTVEEVGVRATRIRTFSDSLIYVPNGTLADSNVNNMGLRVYRRFMFKVGLTYDTPPDKIEAFVYGVRAIIKKYPDSRKDYYEVWFNEMAGFSLNILVYMFFEVPTWTKELKGKQEVMLAIMRLAEVLGVAFAFPTQTLHMENFPDRTSLTPTHKGDPATYKTRVDEFLAKWEIKEGQNDVTGAFAGSGS